VVCQEQACKAQVITYDPFMFLSLPISQDSSETKLTLTACLTALTEVKNQESWYCVSCKRRVRATQKIDLWKVPDVLIIHLKRFAFPDKIYTHVRFSRSLDVGGWFKSEAPKPPNYDLFAVSNHFGTLTSGHYTAFAKNILEQKWYEFSDRFVKPVEPWQVETGHAYVLFYKRIW